MARLPTTSDVFNAIAEPQRRQIVDLLAQGPRSVNEIAEALDLKQPQTSKHLRVLRQVNLVSVRTEGKQRLYSLNAEKLQPVHDWVKTYERFWNERFDRLADYLSQLQTEEKSHEQGK
jgi:DNA-binding transcriptional ArsR family regulator